LSEQDSRVARLTTTSITETAAWLRRPEAVIRAELDALTPPENK
jgi:hypothetical protein